MLALEAIIIERLRAQGLAGVTVATLRSLAANLEDLQRKPLPTPALLVAFGGGRVVQSRPDGRALRLAQDWVVACVVRNLANAAPGAAEDAGELADQALEALMGWQPPGASAPLTLTDLPPLEFGSGYLWLPLTFSTEIIRRAPALPTAS